MSDNTPLLPQMMVTEWREQIAQGVWLSQDASYSWLFAKQT